MSEWRKLATSAPAQNRETAPRSTREVFEDHLRRRSAGEFEEDLRRNFAPDVVLLTENSALVGHDALRRSMTRLREEVPDARYCYLARQVRGEYALLIWEADSDRARARCGADTFVIRDGFIIMQSIHYCLTD